MRKIVNASLHHGEFINSLTLVSYLSSGGAPRSTAILRLNLEQRVGTIDEGEGVISLSKFSRHWSLSPPEANLFKLRK
ncbi:hypothetical protein HS1genome_1405 [Sulfodiicoccus acidiphilus]|uniref:Uncharacterized protein n=1 Tax=Sulfodiicoccus acidiphilus TaxID=1670455 RepID=A0A348B4B4_9CREN|nr:hypothetical protein [Sulfodiicoccus acidiphilus]BBD73016.1 hypothetical protein HS1genome_1405 [Sulfodiicoccus acidiphilus]GGU04508.1 hypothetical protein GCM10007116_21380 [Sulfodiicoccus acidiphilus]